MRNKSKTHLVVMIALFIALDVVLTRILSINTGVIRIGFGFVPIAICAMMFGPLWAAAAAALADIIGVFLFPMGAYFPGFTLSAAIVGLVFGLFLRKSKGGWPPILFAVVIICFGDILFLRTFWLTIITGNPFYVLLPMRLVQAAIMFIVQFTVLNFIEKTIGTRIRNFYNAPRQNDYQA